MSTRPHRAGSIRSGDVTLFYRHFGARGATPVLILHGANYYDSADWVDVASALAADREVVTWDMRGFGASSWSPSKDYSYDAILGDMTALLGHFGWSRAVIVGHSLGGSYAVLFAARFPQQTAGLVLVDHCPGKVNAAAVSVGNKTKIYPTIEVALADTSREKAIPPGSPQWARLQQIFKQVEGGFVFQRDPDYGNRVPPGGGTAKIKPADTRAELATVQTPVLILRGTQTDRYTPEPLARVARDFPKVELVDVNSGHDVATGAPDALITTVGRFLAARIDALQAAAS